MTSRKIGSSDRLRGKTLFLSASIPSEGRDSRFLRVPDVQVYVTDAVSAVARAVIAHQGTLVFGGHPTITPLVSLIAGEYLQHRPAEPVGPAERPAQETARGVVYQSEAFRGYLPDETWAIGALRLAEIRWVDAVAGEQFDPELIGQPQCEASLGEMRRTMLEATQPNAMVCIGGMEGVEKEASIFAEICPGRPIFTLQTTGGAAGLIAQREAELSRNAFKMVSVLDGPEIVERYANFRQRAEERARGDEAPGKDAGRRPRDEESGGEPSGHEEPYTSREPPYPLVADRIVRHLAG